MKIPLLLFPSPSRYAVDLDIQAGRRQSRSLDIGGILFYTVRHYKFHNVDKPYVKY